MQIIRGPWSHGAVTYLGVLQEEFPLSLPRSISSTSHPSKLRGMLLTLGSELALLHVARGESIAPVVLLFVGFVLTLYPEEAGTFVRTDRRLTGMLRLISYIKKIPKFKLKATSKNGFC